MLTSWWKPLPMMQFMICLIHWRFLKSISIPPSFPLAHQTLRADLSRGMLSSWQTSEESEKGELTSHTHFHWSSHTSLVMEMKRDQGVEVRFTEHLHNDMKRASAFMTDLTFYEQQLLETRYSHTYFRQETREVTCLALWIQDRPQIPILSAIQYIFHWYYILKYILKLACDFSHSL